MMQQQQAAERIVKVKSSVEFLCGLLQALGITSLSPELIRRAKFNHGSATTPLLHALLDLLALIFRLAPQASITPTTSSQQNGSHAGSLVLQKKKKNSIVLKHSYPCTPSSSASSSANGHFEASSCDGKPNRCDSSCACNSQLDTKHLRSNRVATLSSSSSSSSDSVQGKPNHGESANLERSVSCKHSTGSFSKSQYHAHLHSQQQRNRIPCHAQITRGNTSSTELHRFNMLSKHSKRRKNGCNVRAPEYGTGKDPNDTVTTAAVLSKRPIAVVSSELRKSNAGSPVSSLSHSQEDSQVHNGVKADAILSLVSMASCNHEQHPSEETNEKLEYVEFCLARWGYPHKLPFLAIVGDVQQSRPLLLAMVWTLFRFDVFKRTLRDQLEPLMFFVKKAPLPPYPPDVSQTREALEIGKEAEGNARALVSKLCSSLDSLGNVKARLAARTQQAIILIGKVTLCMKNLHSLNLSKGRLRQALEDLQTEKKILHPAHRKPLNQYELHLLQHKEDLRLHLDASRADKVVTQKMEELQKHESLFREWIDSVVDLSVAEGQCNDVSDKEITHFKQQLSHRGEQQGSVCKTLPDCASGVVGGLHTLSSTGKDIMAKTEQRNGVQILAQILTGIQQNQNERDVNTRACSVLEKTERLAQFAMALNQVLASSHSRAMLCEALGPVLNERCPSLLALRKNAKAIVNVHSKAATM